MDARPPIGEFFTTSHSLPPSPFHWLRWRVRTDASLRRMNGQCGRPCVNLKHLLPRASGLAACMLTGEPAISQPPCLPTTPRAPLTRICTLIASSSMRPLMPRKVAGKHSKITNFCAPGNLPRTHIIMNSRLNCVPLAIRFATGLPVISKLKAFQRSFAGDFPNVMHRSMRRWPSCLRKSPNSVAPTSKIYGNGWRPRNGHDNKRI